MMQNTIIRLCYRKIIDSASQKSWDKYVWEDSYRELMMQAQMYNADKKYKLYSELVKSVKEAEKLPYIVSTAVINYLKQLNGIIPDIVTVLNKLCIPFRNYKFEIIESDLTNGAAHRIAIDFISEPLIWHDTVNDCLLFSINGNLDINDGAMLTEMIAMQPLLSIFSLKRDLL